jgi:hypothetical protein
MRSRLMSYPLTLSHRILKMQPVPYSCSIVLLSLSYALSLRALGSDELTQHDMQEYSTPKYMLQITVVACVSFGKPGLA